MKQLTSSFPSFIRVAGASRPAHPEKIKELEMEGARISWDELTCVGYTVTDEAVTKLCADIMNYRKKAELSQRNVTRNQLENWKLLKESGGCNAASNAFVLTFCFFTGEDLVQEIAH